MKKIIGVLALALAVLVSFHPAQAQQTDKVYRIGVITRNSASMYKDNLDIIREGLLDLGYIEGQNLLIEDRYAEERRDRIPNFVNELVQHEVDVIFTNSQRAIRDAKKATKTIPIVMMSGIDPVAAGHVDSLARPGGNITGISRFKDGLSAKCMELLKEVVPKMTRVAILWDPDGRGPAAIFKEAEAASRAFKMDLQSLEVRVPDPDIEGLFQAVKKGRSEALFIIGNPMMTQHRKRILKLATRDRLPSMCPSPSWVRRGGLMSYRYDNDDLYRRAAIYIDKILKGAKPADLPVEQPMKFLLHVNLKTAKELGLTIPPGILMRVDEVIK